MKCVLVIVLTLWSLFVKGQCKADFEPNDTIWTAIKFWNYSEGDFNKQLWTFGDGNTATIYSPWNYYDTIGTYQVCLKVWSDGCADSVCKDISIYYPCPPEYFGFNYSTYGDSVTFLPSGSDNMNLLWDFGDGDTSYEITPYHIYGDTGIYETCLIAANYDSSCFDTVCHDVRVGYPGIVAKFSYLNIGRFVEFFDESYRYEGVPWIDTKIWTFDDNEIIDKQYSDIIFYKYYNKSGIHTVCLNISDWTNAFTSTFCDTIVIDSINCRVRFQLIEVERSFTETTVDLINNSEFESGPVWYWSYGDSTSEQVYQPEQKTFLVYDMYDTEKGVCLYAIDSNKCEDKFCLPLYFGIADDMKDIKKSKLKIIISPNPFINSLNIKLENITDKEIKIKMVNINGEVVFNKSFPFQDYYNLDLNKFEEGLYFIIIQTKTSHFVGKIMKI